MSSPQSPHRSSPSASTSDAPSPNEEVVVPVRVLNINSTSDGQSESPPASVKERSSFSKENNDQRSKSGGHSEDDQFEAYLLRDQNVAFSAANQTPLLFNLDVNGRSSNSEEFYHFLMRPFSLLLEFKNLDYIRIFQNQVK